MKKELILMIIQKLSLIQKPTNFDKNLHITGYQMAMSTVETLESEQNDEHFDIFYNDVLESAKKYKIEEPTSPRKRKRPAKLLETLDPVPLYSSSTEMYRTYYYEALEKIISNLKSRFQHQGYNIVKNLENLLLKSATGQNYQEELQEVTDFYASDINRNMLETQLVSFRANFEKLKKEKVVLNDIVEFMRQPNYSTLLSEISTVLKLIMVLPATNAEAERGFSTLKRVKTYPKNKMEQGRLNNLVLMNIHKEETKKMCLKEVANEFAASNDRRRAHFGDKKFK